MLFVSNCNETDNKTNSKDITIIENVELNEGTKKWKTNIETTDGIREMQKLISDFEKSEKLKDYKKLGRQIKKLLKKTKKATKNLEIATSEQVISYLQPLDNYTKTLKTTKSISEAEKTVYSFERHLNAYFEYFE